MALVSKHWPFINPRTIDGLSVAWWAYYVRAAQAIVDATREASKATTTVRDVRRRNGV
jgi:hypothetical protein